ncbi:MAG TPA: UPF0147 family protein [Euryarchaeota archaeon]|nr:hypothetical protein BMS3Bbin15_00665 [archaeon BMS3Bbin15]HDL15475.1 UPF0147 family protein [Euryarchaeota archaeon]
MTDEETKVEQICKVLSQLIEDTSVPRNIRRAAEEARTTLLNKGKDMGVRVSSAIYILEEISNDRNLPLHARTLIWNVSSELETIKI